MAFRSKGEERNEPVAGIKWGDNEGAELYAASGESGDAKRRKNAGCEAVMAAIVSRRLLILFSSSSSFPSLPAHRPPQHPSKLLPLRQPPHDNDIHALSLSLSLSRYLLPFSIRAILLHQTEHPEMWHSHSVSLPPSLARSLARLSSSQSIRWLLVRSIFSLVFRKAVTVSTVNYSLWCISWNLCPSSKTRVAHFVTFPFCFATQHPFNLGIHGSSNFFFFFLTAV